MDYYPVENEEKIESDDNVYIFYNFFQQNPKIYKSIFDKK